MATHTVRIPRLALRLVFGLALGLSLASGTEVVAARMACDDPSNLCLEEASGAKWEAGKTVAAKEKKKRSDKTTGSLSLTVEGGRGSLFFNGRYAGTAPLSGISVPAGKSDVQVRDGATVLSQGVLTVPKGGALTITVKHP
ncbi:MAG: hypothetical protein IAG13_21860 [Deltaproteobacteria bacterium]|nr:hypothetical protein [Nannocystaceae bacterium]